MKVYKRVDGPIQEWIFAEARGKALYLMDGRWWDSVSWKAQDLLDKRYFRLVGNNFKLK